METHEKRREKKTREGIKEANDNDMAIRVTEVQEMIQRRNRGRDGRVMTVRMNKLTAVTTSAAGHRKVPLFVSFNECLVRLILCFGWQLQARRRYRPRLRYWPAQIFIYEEFIINL